METGTDKNIDTSASKRRISTLQQLVSPRLTLQHQTSNKRTNTGTHETNKSASCKNF